MIFKILDVVSLSIQFAGAILMYINSPVSLPVYPAQMGGVTDNVTFKIKNKWLGIGFFTLSFGILISLILVIIKDFVPIQISS